jgi:uncharacterized damage-inducible protein DinB
VTYREDVTDVDEQGRPEPPLDGDEAATLLGFLNFQRATLEWKCTGVPDAAMHVTTAASAMTLGGLLQHLAFVEDHWTAVLSDGAALPPWDTVDWEADHDWEWHSAQGQSAEQLLAFWRTSVVRSQALVEAALTQSGLGQLAERAASDGRVPNLRWILVHLIEEYARHNGHADLLREAIDGATGE